MIQGQANDYEYLDLWTLLSRTYHAIGNLRDEEANKIGISRHHAYIIFLILTLGNNATPTEISNCTFRKKNSISDILNRMVKIGLLTKAKDANKKGSVRVTVTEKGVTQSPLHRVSVR